jgi:hypothetical protein
MATITITGEQIGSNKPWIARINGPDPKYRLARAFEAGVRDYGAANSVGSRGISTTWVLGDGVYEISIPKSSKTIDRYFAEVIDGRMQRLTAEEVIKMVTQATGG